MSVVMSRIVVGVLCFFGGYAIGWMARDMER